MEPSNTFVTQGATTRKRIIVVGVIALLTVAVWLLVDFMSFGHIEIRGRSDIVSGSTISVSISTPDSNPTELTLKAGEVKKIRAKKGSYRIDSLADNVKSIDVVNVRGRKVSSITVPMGEQHAVRKLGSNAQYCPIVIEDKVYSYDCHGEGGIYLHGALSNTFLDPSVPMFAGASFSALFRVQNGLLVLDTSSLGNASSLVYADLQTNTVQEVALPDEVKERLAQERPNIIVSPDPTKPYFLLVFTSQGSAYLFRNISDTNPVKLDLPPDAALNDDFGITTFSFYNHSVISYAGRPDALENKLLGRDDTVGEDARNRQSSIYEFNNDGKVVKTIVLPKDFTANGVYKVTDSFYAVQQNYGLELYYYSDNEFRKVYTLSEGTQPLIVDDKIYCVANNSLYAFRGHDDGSFSLESVFTSSAIAVSELFVGPEGVIFTGYSNRSGQRPLDIFQLLETGQETPPFEEQFPAEKLSRYITGYDYDDKTIVFYLGSAGSASPSRAQLLEGLKDRIEELGIDVGGREIQLGPLN